MKKHHLLATLLALALMLSVFPVTTAGAARYRDPVSVYIDDVLVSDIDAYMDGNGDVYVSTVNDLFRIFPSRLDCTVVSYDPSVGILLSKYLDDFGYDYEFGYDYHHNMLCGYFLYIYTDQSSNYPLDNGGNYPLDNWSDNSFDYPDVYINGKYFPISNISQYTKIDFSKYSNIVLSKNRIYLNNDGNTPVEVKVNGNLISFPDQQPIVMKPGRTMVPIRTIAEMFGCKVEWDNKQSCAVISSRKSTMRIFPGTTSYLFNGKYYTMDVTPTVLNGRTLVPLRFIAERFGYTVDFNSGDVLTVILNSQ